MHTTVHCTHVCTLRQCTPLCNDEFMQIEPTRSRGMDDTRERILDGALDVLGRNPDAGMNDIASAVGVVRRTVYGYFPTRGDLVRTLAQQAVDEIAAILREVDASGGSPERVWVDFLARLWPLVHRYRVLVTLRRGEYGREIHALVKPIDTSLADLVQKGQDAGIFGRHLRAPLLSQIAFSSVFAVADSSLSDPGVGAEAAIVTSLLVLGVPDLRAKALVNHRA
jgi:AcrR family transcriptional regulator